MNILLATETITTGGAETFVLRLANALQQKGHKVWLFVFYKNLINKALYEQLAPNVTLVSANIPSAPLLQKVDSALFRLKIDQSFRDKHIQAALEKLIDTQQIDVIHSNLLKVDRICLNAAAKKNIPVITTIHGDYIQFYNKTKKGTAIPLLNYERKAVKNLSRLKQIVCISDKQIEFFNKTFPEQTKGILSKIYNGYSTVPYTSTNAPLRDKLGIKPSDFVFGMVSRGLPEKGWEVAIKAFLQLDNPATHLVLVGDSEHLQQLKENYKSHTNIHFAGNSNKPLEWIEIFDAGLLPTTYASESLPTVVIEYLYAGKPVIASDAGEINNMLRIGSDAAGITVPIVNGKVSVTAFTTCMQQYTTDQDYYNSHKNNATHCYQQFDMNKCIDQYLAVYQTAIHQKNS